MKQSITISNILDHINQALQNRDYQNPEAMEARKFDTSALKKISLSVANA